MKIVIVDYGIGNISSIRNAFERLNLSAPIVSNNHKELAEADGLILPGVGAFGECSRKIRQLGLDVFLNEVVVEKKKPILGICVGMQLMADASVEGGFHEGMGWVPGQVIRLAPESNFQVPHVGWNDINFKGDQVLFERMSQNTHFYFDHSYHFACEKEYAIATIHYDIEVVVAVNRGNIFGVQFHPEKSSNAGLKLFRNFTRYIEQC